jgi:hypothetical protein
VQHFEVFLGRHPLTLLAVPSEKIEQCFDDLQWEGSPFGVSSQAKNASRLAEV